jgi:prepilin peptidase CpaA
MILPVLLTVVGAIIILAAVYDAATLTIPNWISAVLTAIFPVVAVSSNLGLGDVGIHAAIGFAALVVGVGMFAMNWIGGGDAKFFAAVSLYVGLSSFGSYATVVVVAGGMLALTILGARTLARSGLPMDWFLKFTRGGSVIPYGIAIAIGALFVLPETRLFAAALV